MRPEIYLLTIWLPLMAVMIVFAMKYASSYAAARAVQAEGKEFKALAEAHASQLALVNSSLKSIEAEVARQSRDLSSIDALLKQVG